jgi:predicted nucleic acid-binding protein
VGVLIDTCVWIDVERGALTPADVVALTENEPVFISPVTIAELKFGAEAAADEQVRQQRFLALARLRSMPLLLIDGDAADIFGKLAADLKAARRRPRNRIHDLWLAAQAIQHSFPFLTRNKADFEDVPGLTC